MIADESYSSENFEFQEFGFEHIVCIEKIVFIFHKQNLPNIVVEFVVFFCSVVSDRLFIILNYHCLLIRRFVLTSHHHHLHLDLEMGLADRNVLNVLQGNRRNKERH